MAADENGNLYVIGHGGNRNQNFRVLRVFDSEGRYLRELMPFPAELAPGAMKDVAAWDEERKTFIPRNVSSLNPEFYSLGHLTLVPASSKDGVHPHGWHDDFQTGRARRRAERVFRGAGTLAEERCDSQHR